MGTLSDWLAQFKLGLMLTTAAALGGGITTLANSSDLAAAVREQAATLQNHESRLRTLEQAVAIIAYTSCVQIRRTDPTLLPPNCSAALSDGGPQ